MSDAIDDVFLDIYSAVVADYNQEDSLGITDFLNIITEYGLMLVPIEDPTNLVIGLVNE